MGNGSSTVKKGMEAVSAGVDSVKSYFSSYGTRDPDHPYNDDSLHYTGFAKGPVFMQLPRPMRQYQDQCFRWVEEALFYDEDGLGFHVAVGPLT